MSAGGCGVVSVCRHVFVLDTAKQVVHNSHYLAHVLSGGAAFGILLSKDIYALAVLANEEYSFGNVRRRGRRDRPLGRHPNLRWVGP